MKHQIHGCLLALLSLTLTPALAHQVKKSAPKTAPATTPPTPQSVGFTPKVLVVVSRVGMEGVLDAYEANWVPKDNRIWAYTQDPVLVDAFKKHAGYYALRGKQFLGSATGGYAGLSAEQGSIRIQAGMAYLEANNGRAWAEGEHKGSTWSFADGERVVQIFPMEDSFHPVEVKVLGFERAKVVALGFHDDAGSYPVATEGLIAYARNGAEIHGVFRFPMMPGAVRLRGIELRPGVIYLEAMDEIQALGQFKFRETHQWDIRSFPGFQQFSLGKQRLRFVLDAEGLSIGYHPKVRFNPGGDFITQMETAAMVATPNLVSFPTLEAAVKDKIQNDVWLLSDEEEGFLAASDRAWVEAKLPVAIPASAHHSVRTDIKQTADAHLRPMVQRAERFGASQIPMVVVVP